MPLSRRVLTFWTLPLLLSSWSSLCLAQSPNFTQDQAAEGRRAYREHCASCHGAKLEGIDVNPSLVGIRFDQSWRGKSAEILATHMRRMPPEAVSEPGSLGDDTHTNILAYILVSNGFPASDIALPSGTEHLREVILPRLEGVNYDLDAPVAKTPEQEQLLDELPPVTEDVLLNPSPNDWVNWGRTYDMHNFSPLDSINKENVGKLAPAWRTPLQRGMSNPSPLVYRGVMFLHTFPDTVLALDAASGDILWRYQHNPEGPSTHKMGIALSGEKVLVPTSDFHLVALDMKSGAVIWDQLIARDHDRFELRSAPLVVKDKVILGVTGVHVPKGGFIVAVDVETGEEEWRFNTIARPGELGGNTWNDLPLERRSGGSVWGQGSYDADLNLVYFGTAPTYATNLLLHPTDKAGHNNDALFTNTTLALNPDTGELVWYFQHLANDQLDLDWAFERQILDLMVDGEMHRVVLTVGKIAILDALDAATGKYLFSIDMGLQNVVESIDPETGRKNQNPLAAVPDKTKTTYLSSNHYGARCWPLLSYNAETKRIYLPLIEGGMYIGPEGHQLLTVRFGIKPSPDPNSDGKMGRVQAVDLEGQQFDWRYRQAPPVITSLLATAGGLVFGGDVNRSFIAFDNTTGEILWKTELGDIPTSNIVSYSIDGQQYISVVVGMRGYFSNDWGRVYHQFAEELKMPVNDTPRGGPAIWTFSL